VGLSLTYAIEGHVYVQEQGASQLIEEVDATSSDGAAFVSARGTVLLFL
jgi:hypothetical protein